MNLLSLLRLRTKLALLLGLASLAVVASIILGAVTLHDRMIEDRIDKLRAVVDLGQSLAQGLADEVAAKHLTQDQAESRLRESIHAMRFDNKTGYLTVGTVGANRDEIVVIHGSDPSLEGKVPEAKASDGRLIRDVIKDALTGHDSGVISYMFRKPGQTALTRKVSYVVSFKPWNLQFIAGAYTDDLDADFDMALWHLTVIGGLILAATLIVAWLVNRDITQSLGRLRSAMDRLAKGDLATQVPGTNRRDEVGSMAKAVLVFKDHMGTEAQLAAEQMEGQQRIAAEKHAALFTMADRIEAGTKTALEEIATGTAAMTTTAAEMSASAARTGQSAQGAAAASALALTNAQTVASAAEQLSASISEITRQVGRSSDVVGQAVAAGTETRATIEALNQQVERINSVADMIGEIAGKTNLLALNATIEAARAGDAGKGFAVVASEVKALATQTARFTREIAQHIDQVRAATGASVAAVARIEATISEIDTISGSIAAAMQQQGAATAAIARNVTETASAADDVTNRTMEVSAEAEQSGKRAADVRDRTTALSTSMGQLYQSILEVIRTSLAEMDRRQATRHPVDLPCRLSTPGQAMVAARIVDISENGAAVRGNPPLPTGTRGTLRVDGVGFDLPFVVRQSDDDGTLRLAFDLDEATKGKLGHWTARLSLKSAA